MMSEFGSDPNADMQDGTRGLVAAVVVACTRMGCLQVFGFLQKVHLCHQLFGVSGVRAFYNFKNYGSYLLFQKPFTLAQPCF